MKKAFEKQIKTIENQGEKQFKALKDLTKIKKNKKMQFKANLMIKMINQKLQRYLKILLKKKKLNK